MKTKIYYYDNDGYEVPSEKATWAEELATSNEGTVISRRQFFTDKYKPTEKLLIGPKKT